MTHARQAARVRRGPVRGAGADRKTHTEDKVDSNESTLIRVRGSQVVCTYESSCACAIGAETDRQADGQRVTRRSDGTSQLAFG